MLSTLTKSAVLAVLAGSLQAGFPAAAEAQVSSVAVGRRCNMSAVTDPTTGAGDVQTGQLNGGPLVAETPGATVTLTCTIQIGAANVTHAGADSCVASSGPSVQTAVLAPTLCSFLSPEGQPEYICNQATINGETWYWDATIVQSGQTEVAAGWTTSSSAFCNEILQQELLPGPAKPVLDLVSSSHHDLFPHQACSEPVQLHCNVGGSEDAHCVLWIAPECAPVPELVTVVACLQLI